MRQNPVKKNKSLYVQMDSHIDPVVRILAIPDDANEHFLCQKTMNIANGQRNGRNRYDYTCCAKIANDLEWAVLFG